MSLFWMKRQPQQAAGLLARFLAMACALALVFPTSFLMMPGKAWGQANLIPRSLKEVELIPIGGVEAALDPYLNIDPLSPVPIATQRQAAKAWAIALGKALLWDMQVGSDGKTACASCHFRAGTDHRAINTLHPGANGAFNVVDRGTGTVIGAGGTLTGDEFPFHQRGVSTRRGVTFTPEFQASPVIQDYDDAVGAQGIQAFEFADINLGIPFDEPGAPITTVFGTNRQLTRRNAPTYINSAFNFTAFHNGHANNVFNGVNPFGPEDQNAWVVENVAGALTDGSPQVIGAPAPASLSPSFLKLRLRHAALASQALDPPVSSVEMSYRGRTWPKIGKKMLHPAIVPLGQQKVHINDSVFGPANASYGPPRNVPALPLGVDIVANIPPGGTEGTGLTLKYADLVKNAFNPKYWNNTTKKITYTQQNVNGVTVTVPTISDGAPTNTNEFTQMEANFSMFFGLAVQLYEMTLISDDSKFDRVFDDGSTETFDFNEAQGLQLFLEVGCGACHGFPEFTAHSQRAIQGTGPVGGNPFAAIGVERQPKFGFSLVDEGIYNIGVRPTTEDVGRGAFTPPFDTRARRQKALRDGTLPLSFTELALLNEAGAFGGPNGPGNDFGDLREFIPDLPAAGIQVSRSEMVQGSFKVPTLRNVDLTGPYFRNGSVLTLAQIMDFYTRGGNFPKDNVKNLHPAIIELFALQNPPGPDPHQLMIIFFQTLTDPRVSEDAVPFDHPGILVPNWDDPDNPVPVVINGESFGEVPAVGAAGRTFQGLLPVGAFLDANQFIDPFVPAP